MNTPLQCKKKLKLTSHGAIFKAKLLAIVANKIVVGVVVVTRSEYGENAKRFLLRFAWQF